ncbi:MAG: hypothetical protein HYS12_18825 [Planctomycetes bacterium]|nr:hypothetical protein [Planctomycetota bacterium]
MQLLFTSLPTLTVSILYCAWNAYRSARLQRERKLRERVAYMLWVIATEVD